MVRTSAAAAIGTCAGGTAGFGGAPPPPGGPGAPGPPPPPPEGVPLGSPPPPERLKAVLKAVWICWTRSVAGVDVVAEDDVAGGGPDLPPPVVVVVVVCVWVAILWTGRNLAGRIGLSEGAVSGGKGMDAGSGVLLRFWTGSLSQTSLWESSDSLAESTSALTDRGSSYRTSNSWTSGLGFPRKGRFARLSCGASCHCPLCNTTVKAPRPIDRSSLVKIRMSYPRLFDLWFASTYTIRRLSMIRWSKRATMPFSRYTLAAVVLDSAVVKKRSRV